MEGVTGPILTLEEFDQLYERVWRAYAAPTTPQPYMHAAISPPASVPAPSEDRRASPTPAARISAPLCIAFFIGLS